VPGRRPVRRAERARQPGQPLAQQPVDLLWAEPVADLLQGGRIVDTGEPVVQFLKADASPGGLPLRPVVAVEAFSELFKITRVGVARLS
jgi:hypothetical protein